MSKAPHYISRVLGFNQTQKQFRLILMSIYISRFQSIHLYRRDLFKTVEESLSLILILSILYLDVIWYSRVYMMNRNSCLSFKSYPWCPLNFKFINITQHFKMDVVLSFCSVATNKKKSSNYFLFNEINDAYYIVISIIPQTLHSYFIPGS